MGKNKMEDERGKETLKEFHKNKKRQYTCANCGNNTFVMQNHSDFPYFDTICSKCGSCFIKEGRC